MYCAVLQVVCPSLFTLSSSSLNEIHLTLKTLSAVTSNVLVTVVDVDTKQLIDCWMICLSSQCPTVTRAFEIELPLGETKAIQKVGYKILYASYLLCM